MGVHLLLVSTARGSGLAVNSKTKQDTFMKMISAGAGLGVGVKDYRVVFVFENQNALQHFLDSGWGGFSAGRCGGQDKQGGRSLLGCFRDCAGRVGVPDHQRGPCPAGDAARYEVLQR